MQVHRRPEQAITEETNKIVDVRLPVNFTEAHRAAGLRFVQENPRR